MKVEFEASVACPACRASITTAKAILQFRRVYLKPCKKHLDLWDAADAVASKKERK